jgi:hypothetical protein
MSLCLISHHIKILTSVLDEDLNANVTLRQLWRQYQLCKSDGLTTFYNTKKIKIVSLTEIISYLPLYQREYVYENAKEIMSAYLRRWASQVHEGKRLEGNSVICNLFSKTDFIRNDHVEQAHSMRGRNV